MAVAIFLTGDLLRECALSSRTSAFDQERRLRRLARLVAITHLSRRNWGINIGGARPSRVGRTLPFASTSGMARRRQRRQTPCSGLDDYATAVAAYWAAVDNRPKDKITLRQDIRVVVKNWSDNKQRGLQLLAQGVRAYQASWRRAVVDHSRCDRMDSSSLAWTISGSSISSIASSAVTSRPSHSCFQASCLWPLSLFCHRSLRSLA